MHRPGRWSTLEDAQRDANDRFPRGDVSPNDLVVHQQYAQAVLNAM